MGSGAGLGALDKKKPTPAGTQTPDRPARSLVVIPTTTSRHSFYKHYTVLSAVLRSLTEKLPDLKDLFLGFRPSLYCKICV